MAADLVTPTAFVGVDSGGTRTNVALEMIDENGDTTEAYYEVGESLSGALPIEMIPNVLGAILSPLQVHAGDYDLSKSSVYVWISAAGFTPWTRDDYLLALKRLLPGLAGGSIRSAAAANDGVSLLLGSRADGIVIAGTGSTVIVQTKDGRLDQAGGQEWVACDDGAGFWIGIRAIRKAYRDFESGEDGSALLQRLRQCYSLGSSDDALVEKLRELAIGSKDMKKEIARFAADVCHAAQRGDREAQNIVKSEAEALADVTAIAIRRNFSSDELSGGLEFVECGSVLANKVYQTSFETQIDMRLQSDDLHKAKIGWTQLATGDAAAVRLARDLAESPTRVKNLDKRFRPAIFQDS